MRMEERMTIGHVLSPSPSPCPCPGGKITSFKPESKSASESEAGEMGKKEKAMEHRTRPRAMKGMERSRMRRRPRRSMRRKARRVKVKFVRAMERDVSVGEWKERRETMVAEKYIREF